MLHIFKNHKTIRKYSDKNISTEELKEILEAGIRASTTGNMQLYSIIVSRDSDMKSKLAPIHFNQPMVVQAPVVLTFCADFNRFNLWCKQRNAVPGYDNFLSFFTAAIDALLVAQNVAIAAETKGMGICYLGTTTYNADQLIDVLKLPKGVVPITTITLGYPDENPAQADRLPLSGVIHHEVYQDYNSRRIDEIYFEKEQLEQTKELLKINQKETLAQIFTDNRYKKSDNEHFSEKLLEVLKKQGFLN